MKKRTRSVSTNTRRKVPPPSASSANWVIYVFLAAGLIFAAYVRLRYLQMPLERDEGEFGYIAQRILGGLSPFAAYNYKLPGVPCVYALFMALFGQTIAAIHLALLAASLGTSWLLFFGFRRLLGSAWAAVAAVVYAVLSLDFTVLGTAAHATQFVNLFMAAGLMFILSRKNALGYSFVAGLMMGLSFTMKQPAFLLILYGGTLLLWLQVVRHPGNRRRAWLHFCVYGAGACLPYVTIVLAALRYDQFTLFWKWTVTYPAYYVSVLNSDQGWGNFKIVFGEIVSRYPILYFLAAVGAVSMVSTRERGPEYRFAAPSLLIVSAVMTVPGFYFHHHYFVVLLPAVSICLANAFGQIARWIGRSTAASEFLSIVPFIVITAAGIVSQRDFFFHYSTDDYSRFRYLQNPFREAIPVANYLDSITSPLDRILVIGSEAEIYFYTGRQAASGYLFVHGMVSNQPKNLEMQEEFIAEAEKGKPEAMVLCGVQFSWLKQPGTPDLVLSWFEKYSTSGYEIVGIADMLDQGTVYRWGDEVRGYTPKADNYLIVYRKKKI